MTIEIPPGQDAAERARIRRRRQTRRQRGVSRGLRILLAADAVWLTVQMATSGTIQVLTLLALGGIAIAGIAIAGQFTQELMARQVKAYDEAYQVMRQPADRPWAAVGTAHAVADQMYESARWAYDELARREAEGT